MKLRTVISLSLVSLIAVVLIQLGGMLYAFHAQMQEAEKSLNKCFWMSFTETVDNLVNNLPYPDNSIAIIAYAPNPKYKRIDGDERNKRTSQQAAQALQRVYGIKEIPLATIDSVLHNKLRKLDMDGTLTVERINVNTNEVLATTNPQVSNRNFAAVTSETAFTFKSVGGCPCHSFFPCQGDGEETPVTVIHYMAIAGYGCLCLDCTDEVGIPPTA